MELTRSLEKTQNYDLLDGLFFASFQSILRPLKSAKIVLENESCTTHAEKRDSEVVAIWIRSKVTAQDKIMFVFY